MTKANLSRAKGPINGLAALEYLTGKSDAAPVVKSFADVLALGAFATVATTDAQEKAARMAGGLQALSIAAVLTAAEVLDCGNGKTLRNAANALAGPDEKRTWMYGNTKASDKTVKSLCVRLGESLHFQPSVSSDVAIVFAEALAKVREAMATHGTIKAWLDAVPAASKREPRPEGNAAPGRPVKEEAPAEEVKAPGIAATFDVFAMADKAIDELAKRASRGDVAALEHLRDITSKAMNAFDAAESAAKIKASKRPRKAA